MGLSPLITTLSTATAAPVIAEAWLRSGKTGSGRGAARQLKQAITTARAMRPGGDDHGCAATRRSAPRR